MIIVDAKAVQWGHRARCSSDLTLPLEHFPAPRAGRITIALIFRFGFAGYMDKSW
jgi:hypothetical protein